MTGPFALTKYDVVAFFGGISPSLVSIESVASKDSGGSGVRVPSVSSNSIVLECEALADLNRVLLVLLFSMVKGLRLEVVVGGVIVSSENKAGR